MTTSTQPMLASTALPTLPLRVFLVEDSPAVREQMVEHLSDIPGLVIAGFSDAEGDAFGQLSQQVFDVVIFDIELRQGNGISLLRSLASVPQVPPNLKIIFSNNVSRGYRRVGEQYGVRYFFDKTSELSKLRELLQRLTAGTTIDQP